MAAFTIEDAPAKFTIEDETPEKGAAPNVGIAKDVAKAIPTGLAEGASAVLGTPGDLEHGLNWVVDKIVGHSPEQIAQLNKGALPTSEQILDFLSKPFGGTYKPQTKVGQFAETAASFAPAAFSPGGAGAKAARVLAPAVGSEIAGEATKGSSLEPLARTAGGLLGVGGAEAGIARAADIAEREAQNIPSVKQLQAAAGKLYDEVEAAGVTVKKDSFKGLVDDIKKTVTDEGIDKDIHPKANAALGRLAEIKDDIGLKGIDTLRRVVNAAAGSAEADERRIARIIRDKIDDYVGNLEAKDVTSADPKAATTALKDARSLWSKKAKAEQIESMIEKAKNRSNFTGSGYENALRTEFRKVAQNDRAMRRFSKDEQEAILKVVRGGPAENMFRFVGRFAPQNILHSMSAAAGGYAVGGPVGAIAAPTLGGASRAVATALTKRNAELASEVARRGGAAPKSANTLASHALPLAIGAQSSRGRSLDFGLSDGVNQQ